MGYFDAYRKRLRAESMSQAIELDTDDNIIREFKETPAYKQAYLVDENFDETPLDVRIINVDKSVFVKHFYLLPKTEVKVGQYIRVQEEYFLIEQFEYNSTSPYAKVTYCNQVLKLVDGTIIPCVAQGESYGVKMTATNDVVLETDTKVKVTIGNTPLTRTIHPDFRMIFGNSIQGIYRVGDITMYKMGLIVLTCKKDKYMAGLDDLENGVAWQPDYNYDDKAVVQTEIDYDIIGTREILVGKEYEYILTPNASCDFIVNGEGVEVVKLGLYSITIKCNKANEIFKIKALINDKIIAEKTVITIN